MATEGNSATAKHDEKPKRSRRSFLALGGTAAAAAAAAAAGLGPATRGAEAAPGDPLILGGVNDAGNAQTALLAATNVIDRPALAAVCTGGPGLGGISWNHLGEDPPAGPGVGVFGRSGGNFGVFGNSLAASGMYGVTNGEAGRIAGVAGFSLKPGVDATRAESYVPENYGAVQGVAGVSGSGVGVAGDSEEFVGIAGHTSRGLCGVAGFAPGEIPGVIAHSQEAETEQGPWDGGLALFVSGRAAFLTAGSAVVPPRRKTVHVPNPAVRANSHITITFTGDPGNAATVVQWVERDPGKGFTAHLSTPPPIAVPFTYLIVEPAPPMPVV